MEPLPAVQEGARCKVKWSAGKLFDATILCVGK